MSPLFFVLASAALILEIKQQATTLPSPQPVYKIQSLANRTDTATGITNGYDEAYMDMYGASDRLQYGDCFSDAHKQQDAARLSTLDARIDHALKNTETQSGPWSPTTKVSTFSDPAPSRPATERSETGSGPLSNLFVKKNIASLKNCGRRQQQYQHQLHELPSLSEIPRPHRRQASSGILGEVAKEDSPPDPDKDAPEKGILIVSGEVARGGKRVSFADGYKPGQDSDVEEPPVKKRRKVKRAGCAWPCPAAHPDHVPLWDALPPPPPPPGSPPPRTAPPPPLHLLRQHHTHPTLTLPPALRKLDPNVTLPLFIPSEPPPALIRFP
ncbi:hypothetical protein RR48_05945 [Papilio machaon]|uniref:Uncharacterized protein n=1 Tax=Papilio machaon TaxID=76193 RepID=A0A0N0PEA5_PAPMA|nr:hypothetical protein RR48_05945 [Papilio machaon]